MRSNNYKKDASGKKDRVITYIVDEKRGIHVHHNTAKTIVQLFAVLTWLGALALACLGILFLFFKSYLPALFPQVTLFTNIDTAFGGAAGLILILWAVVSLLLGNGLHHYKNKSRLAFLLMSIILYVGAAFGGMNSTVAWVWGIIAILQFWLFGVQREVVGLFVPRAVPKPVSAATNSKVARQ